MITIIGIDPGLSATGVAIVRGNGRNVSSYRFGSINTSNSQPLPSRLEHIFTRLRQSLAAEKPNLMVVEDVFSLAKFPKSGIMLGQVIGVVMLAGYQAGVPSIEIPVREAKQVLTGNGNAGKKQLEEAVRHRLNHPDPIRPHHASDAMGLALIGFYRYDE